jgi:SAM-dependent methyltransferase
LLAEWEKARTDITTRAEFAHRGWYHALYADGMRGKKVMDVGSGFGVDSITFAQYGAKLTFVDLTESNLKVLERLCKIMELKDIQFVQLKDLDSLKPLDTDYDVIMAMGSLHHAPAEVLRPEVHEVLRHLRCKGGDGSNLLIQSRAGFAKVASLSATGAQSPTAPARLGRNGMICLVILYQEFHNGDFNWFDLLYRGTASAGS